MAKYLAAAVMPLLLAACAPSGSGFSDGAAAACDRADVQDVVGKEARSLMLKGNRDNLIMAGLMGLDLDAVFKAWEEARVTFSGVGAFPSSKGPPFQQIVCGGAIQFDLSDATSGQQIVNVPRARWTINFAQPVDDPATGGFTIEIDPVSLVDGRTINGKPLIATPPNDDQNGTDAGAAEAQPSPDLGNAEDAARAAQAAQADFDAASKPDSDSKQADVPNKAPTEDDLYAPHAN